MKLIMATLKIQGVDNTDSAKKNIGALTEASNVENPSIEIAYAETHNECM